MAAMEGSHRTTWALTILVAAGTLAFDPWGWHPFGPSKWLVITGAAWVAFAFAVRDELSVETRSARVWAAALAWAAVTSVFALEPLSAWLGTPDRRLGFVALATMAVAFLSGQAVVTEAHRRMLGRAAVVAQLGLGMYGAAEALGWSGLELTTTTTRLGSTFGSPAYLGAALALLVPVGIGLASDRGETLLWRTTAGAATLAGVGLLVGSGARAALAGLLAAAAVSVAAWWPRVRRHRAGSAVVGLALVGVIVVSPLGARLGDIGDDPSATGRLAEWRVAAAAVAQRPVLGAGLEGYRVVFPSVVDTDYVRAYGRSTVTDRAHSGPLDLGVALGIPGLVLWLAAAVWLARRAWGAATTGPNLLAGIGAGVVGLVAQELFLFPTLEVGVAGWALAGVLVAAGPGPRVTLPRTGSAVALGLTVLLVVGGALDVAADRVAGAAGASGSVATADRAATLRPDSFRYHLAAADIAYREGRVDVALSHLERARRLAPLDPALALAQARVLAAADGNHLDEIAAAAAADPNHPELQMLLGDALAAAGRAAEAERAWLAAEYLAPNDTDPPIRLAYLYLEAGESEAAAEAIDRVRRIDPAHPALADLENRLGEQ